MSIAKIGVVILLSAMGCSPNTDHQEDESPQLAIVAGMIKAMNERKPEAYVAGFAPEVAVYVDTVLRLQGRQAVMDNRANHFLKYPDARAEIQHMVEIGDKVVLHDKVWLTDKDGQGADIVEIFTFTNGQVIRMEVLQPKDLLSKN